MNMRREKRIEEKNPVVIKSAVTGEGPDIKLGLKAFTSDLSLGGARLSTSKPFAAGTVIRIAINLSDTGQALQVDGMVKWAKKKEMGKGYELGVEFQHNISQTILALIRHLYSAKPEIPASVRQLGAPAV